MTTRLIAERIRSPPRRYGKQTTVSPGGTERTTLIVHPNENELNSNLEQTILHLREELRPENTAKAQDPKSLEFFHFCDLQYSHDPYRYILDCNKVYRFIWFQCFREQRKKGGPKKQEVQELVAITLTMMSMNR
jgi:hypothetical protein